VRLVTFVSLCLITEKLDKEKILIKKFLNGFGIALFIICALIMSVNVSVAQDEWDKSYANPVLNLGTDGTWDKGGASNPSVIFKDYEYKMWYTGFDGEHMRIGYATSIDGTNWTKYSPNPVLDLGTQKSWDSIHIANPSVLFDGITYKMWYTGFDGDHIRIGYANSADGIHWEKFPENPVLDIGAWGSNKNSDVWSPSVVFDGVEYKMWYTGFDGNMKIGFARSSDGIHWTKANAPVLDMGIWGSWDDRGAWSPSVLLDGFEYKMWYTGWNGVSAGIGYATSTDGINWVKPSNSPVLDPGTTGLWDYSYVSNPTVILQDNRYKMWYSGCTNDEIYKIGYAIGVTKPDIEIAERFHDFDDVDAGNYTDWEFTILNKGNADLLIKSVTSDNPVFTVFTSAFKNDMKPISEYVFSSPYVISPRGYLSITVRFSQGKEKTYKGSITVSNNDRDEPESIIQLWMGSKLKYVRQIPDRFESFNDDLYSGIRKDDVRYLQVMLAEEGPWIYPESEINSSFDDFTRIAVINFQRKHKINDGTLGSVGAETRKKLTEQLVRYRKETYDRVAMVHDAVVDNYKDFLPDNFPPELVLAIASQETGLFYNFNNELIEVRENGNKDNVGRGLMQITSSEFVGSGSSNTDDQVVYKCRNLLSKESIYSYYSNTPQGVAANIRDGLYALKTKYKSANNCKGSKELGITDEEMRYISSIQRYNTYGKLLFNIDVDSSLCDELNRCNIPDKLRTIFSITGECSPLSYSAIVTTEDLNRKWRIVDDCRIYIVRRDNDTAYVHRVGAPTVYLKNIADKLRLLKRPSLFPMLKGSRFEDLADKFEAVYNNNQTITLGCPAELSIYDSSGRITGSLVGTSDNKLGDKKINNGFDPSTKDGAEEIPNTMYDKDSKTIVVFLPSDSYRYVVTGTNDGTYELNITSTNDGKAIAFNAVGIPISSKSVHQYTIDWNALSQGKKGVILQIDSDGDGIFDKTITTDTKLIFGKDEPSL
jgi:predicted GH43/DUF377 family glycosyl hydrolase